MNETNALIIGAGPAGLATAAALQNAGIASILLERDSHVGGAYAKLHPDLLLVSPRKFLNLPLHPVNSRKDILSVGEFYAYLQEYTRKLKLAPRVGKNVTSVDTIEESVTVKCSDNSSYTAKFLVVCTGMMSFPNTPPYDTHANPGVRFENASEWRGAENYRGKKVLVVGGGTSASEIATLLSPVAETWLATRSRLKTVPLNIGGVNVHHAFQWIERLPKKLFPEVCGGRWKEPALDFGLVQGIREGRIRVKTGHFELQGGVARFSDKTEMKPDVVISCVGYRFRTDFLPEKFHGSAKTGLAAIKNRSLVHPRVFVVGHPCAGGIDSKFVRGISRDSLRVARAIRRSI